MYFDKKPRHGLQSNLYINHRDTVRLALWHTGLHRVTTGPVLICLNNIQYVRQYTIHVNQCHSRCNMVQMRVTRIPWWCSGHLLWPCPKLGKWKLIIIEIWHLCFLNSVLPMGLNGFNLYHWQVYKANRPTSKHFYGLQSSLLADKIGVDLTIKFF